MLRTTPTASAIPTSSSSTSLRKRYTAQQLRQLRLHQRQQQQQQQHQHQQVVPQKTSTVSRSKSAEPQSEIPEVIVEPLRYRYRNGDFIRSRRYIRGSFLGYGGFARCYEVTLDPEGKKYAAKIIDKQTLTRSSVVDKLRSEIKIHASIRHPHVVQFKKYFEDDRHVYIILELCRCKSMLDLLKERKSLTEEETKYFMLQIIDATKFMHENQIIHRDLKLGNLLLNENMEIKIGDFGLATRLISDDERKNSICGTPNYIAPEILSKKSHGYEVDIWSIGVILYTVLIGTPPFETNDIRETYRKIRAGSFAFPPESLISSRARDLICRILQNDPSRRPSLEQILLHPFFTINPVSMHSCPLSLQEYGNEILTKRSVSSKSRSSSRPKEGYEIHRSPPTGIENEKPTAPGGGDGIGIGTFTRAPFRQISSNVIQQQQQRQQHHQPRLSARIMKDTALPSSKTDRYELLQQHRRQLQRQREQQKLKQQREQKQQEMLQQQQEQELLRQRQEQEQRERELLRQRQEQKQREILRQRQEQEQRERELLRQQQEQEQREQELLRQQQEQRQQELLRQQQQRHGINYFHHQGASQQPRQLPDQNRYHIQTLYPQRHHPQNRQQQQQQQQQISHQKKRGTPEAYDDEEDEEISIMHSRLEQSLAYASKRARGDLQEEMKNLHIDPSTPMDSCQRNAGSSSSTVTSYGGSPSDTPKYRNASTRTTGISGTSTTSTAPSSPFKIQDPEIWVTRWADFSEKYGVAYMMSNGTVGTLFNDFSKMIFSPNGGQIEYWERVQKRGGLQDERTVFSLRSFPPELHKKVKLITEFARFLLRMSPINQPVEKGKMARLGVTAYRSGQTDPQQVQATAALGSMDASSSPPTTYVKRWLLTHHSVVFRLSNKTVQVLFHDQSEIFLASEARLVTYTSPHGQRVTFPLETCRDESLPLPDISLKLQYSKDIILSLISKESF